MKVQQGRDELLGPTGKSSRRLIFDLSVSVDLSSDVPNFLGKFAHGPRSARFIYLNSGTYAGQTDSCWSRRAKISLMSISAQQIRELTRSTGCRLAISFVGTGGPDGGPVCGSIRSFVDDWAIIKK